ncbi:hypothetical protein PROFUN_06416 [Planoprotostelium fungivorum]|uniref:2-(3-amino-3-carboxypropyl)histidine synthase subunit 1 n=1 Tax=Planoprotostelium fungivorum TaxID=1890364 RepID=A0A2P6NNT7_9EUKA|nr:hypothetical protein PROFUN_06416 [Planoprotostelium fungivorum]
MDGSDGVSELTKDTAVTEVKKTKRRFVGRKKANISSDGQDGSLTTTKKITGPRFTQMPAEFLENKELNDAVRTLLPTNYNFEIHKTLWRIKQLMDSKTPNPEGVKEFRVALQFPEGLLMYSCIISDILERFAKVETLIMGDVTYGACCVDDFSAAALGCDLLVHYGHSCLIPIDICNTSVLYVFVDIKFDLDHFVQTVKFNFKEGTKLILISTIQFAASLGLAKNMLLPTFPEIIVPQAKPLSPGEILVSWLISLRYLGDGRFHLESIMISNPELSAYRYDPYSKSFTIENYDFDQMYSIRRSAIERASKGKKYGIILGTLGRQGNPAIVKRLEEACHAAGKESIILLLSEIFPSKLDLMTQVDAWIQVACPRLSIDWGYAFERPLLNPYEAFVAMGQAEWQSVYPMDFYSKEGGKWSVYYQQ